MRRGKSHALETIDGTARAQQLRKRQWIAELNAVRVHVLTKQRDLDDTLADQRFDLQQNVAGPPILLGPSQTWHDAERARVVASDANGDPRRVDRLASRRQRRRENLERFEDLDLRLVGHPSSLQQY